MLFSHLYLSPLGDMTLVSDDQNILGLWFNDQKYFAANYDMKTIKDELNEPNKRASEWLTAYFDGERPSPQSLQLDPQVTEFRKRVLNVLQQIPYGQTMSYKEISDALQNNVAKKTNSSRAVGGAVGHNPISIIIPCHRVIGSDGSLTGYAGGVNRKIALLKLEGVTNL